MKGCGMKTRLTTRIVGLACVLGGAIALGAGCESEKGPAEKAGASVDRAARDVKDTISPPGPAEKAGGPSMMRSRNPDRSGPTLPCEGRFNRQRLGRGPSEGGPRPSSPRRSPGRDASLPHDPTDSEPMDTWIILLVCGWLSGTVSGT